MYCERGVALPLGSLSIKSCLALAIVSNQHHFNGMYGRAYLLNLPGRSSIRSATAMLRCAATNVEKEWFPPVTRFLSRLCAIGIVSTTEYKEKSLIAYVCTCVAVVVEHTLGWKARGDLVELSCCRRLQNGGKHSSVIALSLGVNALLSVNSCTISSSLCQRLRAVAIRSNILR